MVDTAKVKKINNNHYSRNKTCFKKKKFMATKEYYYFLWNFQSIISLNTLKLAWNKRMCMSDNEQGINCSLTQKSLQKWTSLPTEFD